MSVAVINKPVGTCGYASYSFQILRTQGNELGLAAVSGFNNIQLWERKANSNGAVRWSHQKNIKLDKLLSVVPWMGGKGTRIVGYAEEANVIFVSMDAGVFMIQLGSMQFKIFSESPMDWHCYPYESFFTAGRGISGADGCVVMRGNA
ncbi:hypothetical protein ACP4OV_010987 [Aristida adscensionis]